MLIVLFESMCYFPDSFKQQTTPSNKQDELRKKQSKWYLQGVPIPQPLAGDNQLLNKPRSLLIFFRNPQGKERRKLLESKEPNQHQR